MAHDLDLLGTVLCDERLNYLGYSYGSWLGAWYAGLFPEKVGRMVLDGVLDFGASLEQMLYVQPPARQRLFDEVLAPYAVQITFALAAAWKRCAPPCRPLARTCSPCWATT